MAHGAGGQCAVQVSGAAESRSTTGSTVQHQADSAVKSGVCAQLQGRGSCVGPDPSGTEDSVAGCGLRAVLWFSLQ